MAPGLWQAGNGKQEIEKLGRLCGLPRLVAWVVISPTALALPDYSGGLTDTRLYTFEYPLRTC